MQVYIEKVIAIYTIFYYCINHKTIDKFQPETFPLFIASNSLKKYVPKYDTPSNDGKVMKICNTVSDSKFKVTVNDEFILLDFIYYPRF